MNFYLLIPTYDKKDINKITSNFKGFLEESNYPNLYEFVFFDLKENLNILPDKYNQIKTLILQTKIKETINYLNSNVPMFHLIYEDGNIDKSYFSSVSFDYGMSTLINKLINIVNTNQFTKSIIYPILIGNNYNPISINSEGNKVKSLNKIQTYTYEIMVSFLLYANNFYEIQLLLESSINKQLKFNKFSLNMFALGFFCVNALIELTCFLFFRKFNQIIDKKLSRCAQFIKNEQKIKNLQNKLKLLKDLSKLYYKSPVKLVNQLIFRVKNKTLQTTKTFTNNPTTQNIQECPINHFNIGFITNKFIVLLLIYSSIFVVYSIFFIVIYCKSFHNLTTTSKFLESSNYSEENSYLIINLVQIFEYMEIDNTTLKKVLSHVVDNVYSIEKTFLVELLDNVFTNNQQKMELNDKSQFIPEDEKILKISCESFYNDIISNTIQNFHKFYPKIDIETQLINFCNDISSLNYNNDKLLFDVISYESMKFLLRKYYDNKKYNLIFSEKQLLFLLSKLILMYKPYKSFLNNYYFEVILEQQLNKLFAYLLAFLLGNIFLQISNFFLITLCILKSIENTLKNINKINTIFK